ncbi:MAG: branched-chain amino acid ABC transporter permease [Proteobacteria bacterium]|nr:branched-chain amino acid ABC transporter permease [Pseudomonadota bacterium]
MQIVVNIIVLAATYSLVCCGYVLVYRASRVLNLGHGELVALGGYFVFTVALSGHPVPSFVLACGLSLGLGFLVYFFLMRFMTGESVVAAVLVTIALGILLQGTIILSWTSQTFYPVETLGGKSVTFGLPGGASISLYKLLTIICAVAVYLALFLCFKFTRWGLRMRAVGENPLLASQRGIKLHVFYALSWAIAAFSGGLAGMLQACEHGLEPGLFVLGLKAFPVVLVGGLDSLAGVLIGALVVAVAEVVAIQWISPQASEVAPFVVLLIMLLIRPWGIFGTKEELDRV